MSQLLRAPFDIEFDYTRSLGPVLGQFMTALAGRQILGARAADGRVHAPPFEYDPQTAAPPAELVQVGPEGTVQSWTWMTQAVQGQPLPAPFAWALIQLDGADTSMLHAVDAGTMDAMRTGMRVRVRWAASTVGHIRDIACFEPCGAAGHGSSSAGSGGGGGGGGSAPDPVSMITAPIQLHYEHTTSPGESQYLRGLAEGRLLGQRCPVCGKVYIPPRGACPTDGVPTTDEVELPDTGTVTTFCVVNVPFPGQRLKLPYVAASVLLDGADMEFSHLILGCEASEVHIGMRVKAVWKPEAEWGTTAENIAHFRPL